MSGVEYPNFAVKQTRSIQNVRLTGAARNKLCVIQLRFLTSVMARFLVTVTPPDTGGQVFNPQSWQVICVRSAEMVTQVLAVLTLKVYPYWLSFPPPPTVEPFQLKGL